MKPGPLEEPLMLLPDEFLMNNNLPSWSIEAVAITEPAVSGRHVDSRLRSIVSSKIAHLVSDDLVYLFCSNYLQCMQSSQY